MLNLHYLQLAYMNDFELESSVLCCSTHTIFIVSKLLVGQLMWKSNQLKVNCVIILLVGNHILTVRAQRRWTCIRGGMFWLSRETIQGGLTPSVY